MGKQSSIGQIYCTFSVGGVTGYFKSTSNTVQLVIFVGLIFCGLGSSDDFVGLYFHGISPLITSLYTIIFRGQAEHMKSMKI